MHQIGLYKLGRINLLHLLVGTSRCHKLIISHLVSQRWITVHSSGVHDDHIALTPLEGEVLPDALHGLYLSEWQ